MKSTNGGMIGDCKTNVATAVVSRVNSRHPRGLKATIVPDSTKEGRMTITSSGAKCDVCGNFILPGLSESVNLFGVKGIEQTLHCGDDCKKIIIEANGDWHKLPDGPLRKAFEDNAKK